MLARMHNTVVGWWDMIMCSLAIFPIFLIVEISRISRFNFLYVLSWIDLQYDLSIKNYSCSHFLPTKCEFITIEIFQSYNIFWEYKFICPAISITKKYFTIEHRELCLKYVLIIYAKTQAFFSGIDIKFLFTNECETFHKHQKFKYLSPMQSPP